MKSLTLDLAEQEAARCLLCYAPPCSQACPANIDPAGNIRSLRFSNLAGAQEKFRKVNPKNTVCSELCSGKKNCEKACLRGRLDRPVKIKDIQQFIVNTKQKVLKEGVG